MEEGHILSQAKHCFFFMGSNLAAEFKDKYRNAFYYIAPLYHLAFTSMDKVHILR